MVRQKVEMNTKHISLSQPKQSYLPRFLESQGILTSLDPIERADFHCKLGIELGHGIANLQPIVGRRGPRPRTLADAANPRYQTRRLH